MDINQLKEFSRKLWITRKCRIEASERVKKDNDLFQRLLVYYSIILVALSILDMQSKLNTSKSSLLILISSVALSLFSMFVVSRNYNERYINLKNCYIELDKLYMILKEMENSNNIDSEKLETMVDCYNNILKCVENHNEYDFIGFMLSVPEEQQKISVEKVKKYKIYRCMITLRNISFFALPIIIIIVIMLL